MTNIIFDIETTGLNQFEDRIICIGVKTETEELTFMCPDEKELLNYFWNFIFEQDNPILVGFNSHMFDIPFLRIRSMKHGVKTMKITRYNHVDLRLDINNWQKFGKGKLSDYAEILGLEGKYNGLTGASAVDMWLNGETLELHKYTLEDIRITWKLLENARAVKVL